MNRMCIALVVCWLPALAAQAAESRKDGNDHGIGTDIAEARQEVRADLAKARAELETENLEVGDNLHFGTSGSHRPAKGLPKAEISRSGDFLIDGKAQTLDAAQRRELLAYRGLVIDIARTGIDLGERSAQAALDSVDRGMFSLLVGAVTGSLERRMERQARETIQPLALQLCRRLPEVRASQQRLAASVPQFQPYATLEAQDAENCESDVRNEFANL